MDKNKEIKEGEVYGKLTVIKRTSLTPELWECKCQCGNTRIVRGCELRNGHMKSCGCEARRFEDLTGKTFGELTVLKRDKTKKKVYWICQCSCGNQTSVRAAHLKKGLIVTCGVHQNHRRGNKYEIIDDTTMVVIPINSDVKYYFDKEDYEKVCTHTWRVAEHGKYLRSADQENVAFHRLVTDFKWEIVDHKDRDVTNCRKNNLREASPAENRHNMSLAKNNTTGVIGVYKEIKPSGTLTWRARIACNGYIYRKTWHSFEDAVKDRLQKEKELFGDFAPQKHLFSQYGIETN